MRGSRRTSVACGARTKRFYGVRKVWKQPRREGHAVARCTVARLMHRAELRGTVRRRKFNSSRGRRPRTLRRRVRRTSDAPVRRGPAE